MLLPPPTRRLILTLLVLLAAIPGCGGSSKYADLDPYGRATLITELRRKSDKEYEVYIQSGGGKLEALEESVRLEEETTKIDPATCPGCFYRHGRRLKDLAGYYRILVAKFAEERAKTPPGERAELESKIEKYTRLTEDLMQQSVGQLERYVRAGEPLDPEAYYALVVQCDALKDYERALHYLDLYEANVALGPEAKKNADIHRRRWMDARNRRNMEDLEKQLEIEDSAAGRPAPRSRAEPAN
jgi:hypothetical protein